MKTVRILFLVLISGCVARVALAQQSQQMQTQTAPAAPAPGPSTPAPAAHEWVPQGLESLRQSASSKTEFTLDHNMLVFASKLDSGNDDLRRVIAGVSGISVHNYRFPKPWIYDPEALNSIKEEYRTAGWKQLMNNHGKDGGPGENDLWIRFENNAISNVAILLAKANEVDFFLVSGSISPMDLSHLGGHFGIPRIEGGVMVPNTAQR